MPAPGPGMPGKNACYSYKNGADGHNAQIFNGLRSIVTNFLSKFYLSPHENREMSIKGGNSQSLIMQSVDIISNARKAVEVEPRQP